MHAARARVDQARQRVNVGALELGNFAVLKNQTRQLVLRRQLFEHVSRCRDAPGLRLAAHIEIQLLKNLTELYRRVDVELLAGKLIDLRRQPRQFLLHLAARGVERLRVYAHAHALHLKEYLDERQFDQCTGGPRAGKEVGAVDSRAGWLRWRKDDTLQSCGFLYQLPE